MEKVFPLISRLLVVPLGYVAAASAGALALLIGSALLGSTISDGTAADRMLRTTLVANLYFILWPAVAGILLSEALAIRSWKFHLLNVAVSALIGGLAYGAGSGSVPFGQMITAGIAGGFAYWVVAGTTAGFYKPVSASDEPPVAPTAS